MYFWSVSFLFSHFFSRPKKNWLTKKKFGIPKRNLADQKKIWSTKKIFGIPKKNLVYLKKIWLTQKMKNWPDNWYTKETDQKYMDATLKWINNQFFSISVMQNLSLEVYRAIKIRKYCLLLILGRFSKVYLH